MMTEDENAEYTNGPDQVIPVNNMITWKRNGAVKLRISSSGPGSDAPKSIPSLMKQIADKYPTTAAVKTRDPKSNVEQMWTWSQYRDEVRIVAKAFIKLGLARFQSVCILGFNSPEWVISDLAAIHAGSLATGIYPTNGTDACKHILVDSNCSILVVENQTQLNKVWNLTVTGEIPSLVKIVQYSGTPSHPGVMSWRDLLALGRAQSDSELEYRLRRMAVNQACTLIYTSGTTGNPKGVMLSHDNITFTAVNAARDHNWDECPRLLSYLPLSHIAANLMDIYATMVTAGCLYFADKNVLKGTLKDNLQWCRPTQFMGVPRIYEKIMEKMLEIGRENSPMKKKIAASAKEASLNYHSTKKGSAKYQMFQKIVFSKVKNNLGLDQVINFYTGAAPMEPATFRYFLSLDMKIMDIYGMSETTGPHTAQKADQFEEKSVGKPFPSFQSKLVKSDDPEVEDSELWMWGRNIMMGYLNREDATKKDMTPDGWMKSGDLAVIDENGFHFIVGREKDLIITAGGENVAPAPIQAAIKQELPIIGNALLLGDKLKFLSCFLTLAVDINMDTLEPSNNLTPNARAWCQSVGSNATTVEQIIKRPDTRVMAAIQAGIDRVNAVAPSNAQRIQKWMVLPKDFSQPGGEIGPTMKLKRKAITQKYDKSIGKIYGAAKV